MCVFDSKCTLAALPGCATWGVGDVCAQHWAHIKANLKYRDVALGRKQPGDATLPPINDDVYGAGFLDDFARIDVLMRNPAKFLQYMEALCHDAQTVLTFLEQQGKDRAEILHKSGFIKLSRLLEFYEYKCWFPNTHIIATGPLSDADFLDTLKHAYMMKDVGAGAQHGEFSHRFQWHAIMRATTRDFHSANPAGAGWNHSALELCTQFGADNATVNRGAFGYLCDNQNRKDFGQPSNITLAIRRSNSAGLAYLKGNVDRIYNRRIKLDAKLDDPVDKRVRKMEDAGQVKKRSAFGSDAAYNASPLPSTKDAKNVVKGEFLSQVYQEKKRFRVENQNTELLKDLGLVSRSKMPWFLSCLDSQPQEPDYELIYGGNAMLLKGDQMVDDATLNNWKVSSRGSFRY
jgi:hypothetical protein